MTIVIPQQHERDEEQETRQDSSERQKNGPGVVSKLSPTAATGPRCSPLARAR